MNRFNSGVNVVATILAVDYLISTNYSGVTGFTARSANSYSMSSMLRVCNNAATFWGYKNF